MSILFVAPSLEWPLHFGGDIRRWHTLQALLSCSTVDVVTFQSQGLQNQQAFEGCRRVTRLSRKWLSPTARQRRAYESTLGRCGLLARESRPFQFLGPRNTALAGWFSRWVAAEKYDAVWISKANCAIALGWNDPARTILDADDFEYVREYHLLRSTPWYGSKVLNYANLVKLRPFERTLTQKFARVIRCSEDDRLRQPERNVVVIPNGATVPHPLPDRAPEQRVLFVGALGYAPNAFGMEWFLKTVWPQIRQECPHAQLDIVGGGASGWLQAQSGAAGIHVHGFVEHLTPFFQRAALSIVPLLAGGGTRLKIPESLAYAVPVVSTTIGAFGLDLGENEGVMRADQPSDLVRCCCRILREPIQSLAAAQRGRRSVEERYSWDRIRQRIAGLAAEVAGSARSPSGKPYEVV